MDMKITGTDQGFDLVGDRKQANAALECFMSALNDPPVYRNVRFTGSYDREGSVSGVDSVGSEHFLAAVIPIKTRPASWTFQVHRYDLAESVRNNTISRLQKRGIPLELY
jgi:hypothetical protein